MDGPGIEPGERPEPRGEPGADRVLRVVVADDHRVVRGGLRALLHSLPGYQVVGEAADGEAAVREGQLTRPDVVLMDIRMPGLDGLEATRRIRATSPGVAVLVLTMLDDDDTVFATMRAGGQGDVLKGAAQGEIDRAIRAVARGELIFSPGVATRVLGHFSAPPSASGTAAFPGLTAREREVLDRIAAGRRNAAIAAELCISPKTVANHISSIFAKLAVSDRAEAIVMARRQGLGDEPEP